MLITLDVHFIAEWGAERARVNGTSVCVRSQPDSQATMVVLTVVHSIFTAILTFVCNDFLVIMPALLFV